MMEMEKNCNLLYKQELGLWIVNQRECGTKFHTRDIDLLVEVISLPTPQQVILDSIQLDRSKLEILRMRDPIQGTITTFKLDSCQQTLCTEVSKKPKLVKFVQDVRKNLEKEPKLDNVVGLVRGSLNGKCFLGYSEYGHLVLMNLETSTGSLIGRWPVDPEDRFIRTNLSNLNGAVSRDGSLVAIFVPTFDPATEVPDYDMLRVYDIKARQFHTIKLPLDPVISIIYHHYDSVLSFNPFNHNLLYFMTYIGRRDGSFLRSLKVDDYQLVLYDFKEEKILATRREFLLTSYMGSTLGYKNVTSEGPFFLRHGEIIIAYHMGFDLPDRYLNYHYDYIGLLDAFSLDTVATVNLPRFGICHFLVSTCETEIVIFKEDISTGDDEAHVYEIPDYAMSLMNLCRRTIRKAAGYKDYKIDELTMLHPKMRDYLKFA